MKPVLSSALLVAFAALAFAVPARAQQVVYSEGFESGLTGWTAIGLWNLEDSSDTCGSQATPFPEGTKCAWYGNPATCTYETGSTANSGTLTMNDWVDLPDVPSISVHFWMWIQSEYCWRDYYGNQYDVFSVVVSRQTGSSITSLQCGVDGVPASTTLPWHERQVDISAFRGQRVKVSFQFGTGDQLSNNYLGWLVDDVRILAEPGERICPSGSLTSGCPCFPNYVPVAGGCRNSTMQSATLFTEGSPVVSADTLALRVEHMPPNASAILTQASGTGPTLLFGDGLRCISGSLRRMGTVAATAGVATWPPAGTDPIALRGGIPPTGGTRYYYVFYRDTQNFCNPALYNLTDTRRITWVP
jgi:hypothetical protein